MSRFHFNGFRGCEPWCDVEIAEVSDVCTVVVATEVDDNPGTSVTNMAEGLATAVCRLYRISPHKLVWYEHYPQGRFRCRDTWDRVYFDFDWDRAQFTHPRWQPSSRDKLDAFLQEAARREPSEFPTHVGWDGQEHGE